MKVRMYVCFAIELPASIYIEFRSTEYFVSIFITVLLFCGSVSIGNIFYISTCVCCKCIKCPLLISYNISYWLFKIFFLHVAYGSINM